MPQTIQNLSVGHRLPNGWTVTAYAVSDRHAVILASKVSGVIDLKVSYATWTVSQNDLRSTSGGQYFGYHIANAMELAWTNWQSRVTSMYMLS